MEQMRRCKQCGEEFPATIEYFDVRSYYKGKQYLTYVCKECRRMAEQEKRREKAPVKRPLTKKEERALRFHEMVAATPKDEKTGLYRCYWELE